MFVFCTVFTMNSYQLAQFALLSKQESRGLGQWYRFVQGQQRELTGHRGEHDTVLALPSPPWYPVSLVCCTSVNEGRAVTLLIYFCRLQGPRVLQREVGNTI